MTEPFWTWFDDHVRRDHPVWDNHYKVIGQLGGHRTGVRVYQELDTPQKLGYVPFKIHKAKLYMLHLPNASVGWSYLIRGKAEREAEKGYRRQQEAEMLDDLREQHRSIEAKARAEAAAAVASTSAETATEEVIVLELRRAGRKVMSLNWGLHEPLTLLLRALAVIWIMPLHHLVLYTSGQHEEGCGCVGAFDTPASLCLPCGGALSAHFLPCPAYPLPSPLPSLTVAWQVLTTKGLHVWDQNQSEGGGRVRRVIGRRKESTRRRIPSFLKHNPNIFKSKSISVAQKPTIKIETPNQEIKSKSTQQTLKKSNTRKEILKIGRKVKNKRKNPQFKKISSKSRKIPKLTKSPKRRIKTIKRRSDVDKSRVNTKNSDKHPWVSKLNFDQEISLCNKEFQEKNNVTDMKTPVSSSSRSVGLANQVKLSNSSLPTEISSRHKNVSTRIGDEEMRKSEPKI